MRVPLDYRKAQLAPEAVLIAAVMLFFFLAIIVVNSHLQQQSDALQQRLQAGTAANQLAVAINRAAAGGNGTQVSFLNGVGSGVSNMTIYNGRVIRASYAAGGFVDVALATNYTDAQGAVTVPINSQLVLTNLDGRIIIRGE